MTETGSACRSSLIAGLFDLKYPYLVLVYFPRLFMLMTDAWLLGDRLGWTRLNVSLGAGVFRFFQQVCPTRSRLGNTAEDSRLLRAQVGSALVQCNAYRGLHIGNMAPIQAHRRLESLDVMRSEASEEQLPDPDWFHRNVILWTCFANSLVVLFTGINGEHKPCQVIAFGRVILDEHRSLSSDWELENITRLLV